MWDGEVSVLAWEQADARVPSLHFAHANGFNAQTYRTMLQPLAQEMRLYASHTTSLQEVAHRLQAYW